MFRKTHGKRSFGARPSKKKKKHACVWISRDNERQPFFKFSHFEEEKKRYREKHENFADRTGLLYTCNYII